VNDNACPAGLPFRCLKCGSRVRRGRCFEHGPVSRSSTNIAAVADPPKIPGYTVEAVLGAGGFATVYLASRHVGADGAGRSGHEKFAIKVAHYDDVARQVLDDEVKALGRIGAPAVPAIRDFGTTATVPGYVAMEYISGPTLADAMLEGSTEPDVSRLQRIVLPILRALGLVHRAGFVHGDLKPENIILGGPLGATLVDLGLAAEMPAVSPPELPAGTVEYMSPEQCTTGERIDQRSDLYALGVLIVELITHKPVYWGQAEQIREAHRSHRIPNLPLVTPLLRFVSRCLAKEPDRRPSTAAAFEEEFVAALVACSSGSLLETTATASVTPTVEVQGARKETVGLVWFTGSSSPVALRRALEPSHGQIVHVDGSLHVAGFTDAGRENPVRAALMAAETLIADGYTQRAMVDVADVRIRARPNGPPRMMSPRFHQRDRYPRDTDPRGVLVTAEAKVLLSDVSLRSTDRPEVFSVDAEGSVMEQPLSGVTRPLYGRQREVSTLLRSVDVAMRRKPSLCTIEGHRGIGKSHLAHELVEQLRDRAASMRVIALRIPEPFGGVGSRTMSVLFGRLLSLESKLPAHATAHLESAFGAAFMESFGLGLEIALDWVDDADPRLEKLKAAPGALRSTAAVAVGEAIRRTAAKTPIAIVFDDAQFADEILLGAIEYATRREHDLPVWIGVLVRPSFTAGVSRSDWGSGAGSHERLSLGPLDEKSATALVRHLLAPATGVPQWAVANIVERTQASPLLLCELVEGLKRSGCVRRLKRGTGWYLATDALDDIPDLPLVDWLVAREIEQLPQELGQFGGLAAMMGSEFTVDDLNAVNDEIGRATGQVPSFLDASVGIRKLQRVGVLDEQEDGCRFRHEVLRQRLSALVPQERRQEWHRAAYGYFERSAHLDEVGRKARLAHHAALAGMPKAAVRHQLELARIAMARHAYLQAERHFAAALDHCGDVSEDRLDALHGLGSMRYRLGLFEAASATFDDALAVSRSLASRSREVELLLDAATVWDWREDYAFAAALVEQAEQLADGVKSPLLEARLSLGRIRSVFRDLADLPMVCDLAVSAADQAWSLGAEGYETGIAALLIAAPLYAYRGQNDRSQAMFEQILRLCEDHNDAMHLAVAYNNRAALWWSIRDEPRLIADLERVLATAQTYGFAMLESMALRNLAEVHYALANYEPCIRFAAIAIEVGERLSVVGQRVLVALLLLARCRLSMGDLDEARRLVQQIRASQERTRSEGRSDSDLTLTDEALCQAIELSVSQGSREAWDALITRSQMQASPGDFVEVLELQGIATLRSGDCDTAIAMLSTAAEQARATSSLVEGRIRVRLAELCLAS